MRVTESVCVQMFACHRDFKGGGKAGIISACGEEAYAPDSYVVLARKLGPFLPVINDSYWTRRKVSGVSLMLGGGEQSA